MYITITIIIIIIVIIAIINTIIIIILTNWQQFHIEITSHCSKLRRGLVVSLQSFQHLEVISMVNKSTPPG